MDRKYLSPHELSDYTGLDVSTIYLWVKQRKIPFIKISRLVKFDIRKIDNWLQQKEIKSVNDY